MEEQSNSFKLLDELAFNEAQEQDRDTSLEARPVFGQAPPRIYEELKGTFSTYRLLGQLVEVFLPRMVDTMICLTGGEPESDDPEPPAGPTTTPPPPQIDSPQRPTGPLGDPGIPR